MNEGIAFEVDWQLNNNHLNTSQSLLLCLTLHILDNNYPRYFFPNHPIVSHPIIDTFGMFQIACNRTGTIRL